MMEFIRPLRPLWQTIDIMCHKVQSFRVLIICNAQDDCGDNNQLALRLQLANYPSVDGTINIQKGFL